MLRRYALVLACGFLFASPLTAQTVELSSRTFWLGEAPKTLDEFPAFFAPRRIGWIEEIIVADPILRDTVIHVDQALRPTSETIGRIRPTYVRVGPDRLNPQYDLPGYRVLGSPIRPEDPTHPPNRLYYVPLDPDAGFDVACAVDIAHDDLLSCGVNAAYPPDDGIRLKIRLYFPDDPADRPGYFREVVERVRDLVYCLDVTEERVDVRTERPTLTGCRPEETS